jgi:hypothetical protein
MPTASLATVAPEEEPPGGSSAGKENEGIAVSTTESTRPQLFDVSGIDWDDENAIDQTAQLIWTIATTKGETNQ